MSIFGDQAGRLLREQWSSPSELAEELYAMFLSQTPLQIDGPVTITNNNPALPALSVIQPAPINFGSSTVNIPGLPPFTASAYPPDTTTTGDYPGTAVQPPGGQPQPPIQTTTPDGVQSTGPVPIPGRVISGSGSDYLVQLLPNGFPPSDPIEALSWRPGATVPVTQIGGGPQVAAGTPVIVFQVAAYQNGVITHPATYFMRAVTGGGGGGVPGVILSGTGDTYQMTVYPNGRSQAGVNVEAHQLQIDPAEAIPPGTWALVSLMPDGEWVLQVAIWL